jgi:hypothetical protein
MSTKATETSDCVICLEEINNDNITFHCQHSLHTTCFNKYAQHKLQQGQTSIICPLCQKEIMHIHPITIHNTQPMPASNRIRLQSACIKVCNIVMTLGVAALLYHAIESASSKS